MEPGPPEPTVSWEEAWDELWDEPPAPPADAAPERMWSNVNPETLEHEPGSVAGATALVAGTAVGAGILALPTVTQPAGFEASAVALGGAWAYSVVTGLLIAEVNLNTMCDLGSGGASLISMARRTLGDLGAGAAGLTYVFLHYALLVAYISRAGELVGGEALGGPAGTVFTAALGAACYFSGPRRLDQLNSALVGGVLLTFAGLLAACAGGLDFGELGRADWGELPDALPVIALAFVYQNVVPVVSSSLEGDAAKIRTAIVAGTAVPLAMFLLWDAAILGGPGGATGAGDPLAALQAGGGVLSALVPAFSLLAIATSFIGFTLGLSDFLADALGEPSGPPRPLPYALTLGPPAVCALLAKDIFVKALDLAGTFGVLVLFGALPAAMVWAERYGPAAGTGLYPLRFLPGGKPALAAVGALAAAVVLREAAQDLLAALP